MLQVTAEQGEASGQKMQTLVKAMTDGTPREHKFSVDYAWRQAQKDHPEHFIPKQAKSHEDLRAEWLTAQNINDWFKIHKIF